jgi:hypothetical protein
VKDAQRQIVDGVTVDGEKRHDRVIEIPARPARLHIRVGRNEKIALITAVLQ